MKNIGTGKFLDKEFPIWQVGDEIKGMWGGSGVPPEVGTEAIVKRNDMGNGTVVGYFEESGLLGVIILPDNPPSWWLEQRKKAQDGKKTYRLFGGEIL